MGLFNRGSSNTQSAKMSQIAKQRKRDGLGRFANEGNLPAQDFKAGVVALPSHLLSASDSLHSSTRQPPSPRKAPTRSERLGREQKIAGHRSAKQEEARRAPLPHEPSPDATFDDPLIQTAINRTAARIMRDSVSPKECSCDLGANSNGRHDSLCQAYKRMPPEHVGEISPYHHNHTLEDRVSYAFELAVAHHLPEQERRLHPGGPILEAQKKFLRGLDTHMKEPAPIQAPPPRPPARKPAPPSSTSRPKPPPRSPSNSSIPRSRPPALKPLHQKQGHPSRRNRKLFGR